MCEDGKEGMSLILEEPHSWKKTGVIMTFLYLFYLIRLPGNF